MRELRVDVICVHWKQDLSSILDFHMSLGREYVQCCFQWYVFFCIRVTHFFLPILSYLHLFLLALFSAPHKLNLISTFFILSVLWQKSSVDLILLLKMSDLPNGGRKWYVHFLFALSDKSIPVHQLPWVQNMLMRFSTRFSWFLQCISNLCIMSSFIFNEGSCHFFGRQMDARGLDGSEVGFWEPIAGCSRVPGALISWMLDESWLWHCNWVGCPPSHMTHHR